VQGDPVRPNRAEFLKKAGTTVLGAAAALAAATPAVVAADDAPGRRWKGKPDSKVRRWDVITIGNLSRNRYWGEGDEKGVRPAICTCTLIQGDGFRLLADASLADAAQMARELDRRTGLKPKDVTAVFVTHEHGDHFAGTANFPGARWLASPAVADILNRGGKLAKKVEGVTGRLFDAVDVVPTPGHTPGHASLRFDCDGLSVIVAGDAVATRDFFRDRRPFYNAVDVEQSKKTMDAIAAAADVIVPGHDNYFLS
jgi:glyoxylase-like metal-dependent hydrolase (beta-lactamase superfamily II)